MIITFQLTGHLRGEDKKIDEHLIAQWAVWQPVKGLKWGDIYCLQS